MNDDAQRTEAAGMDDRSQTSGPEGAGAMGRSGASMSGGTDVAGTNGTNGASGTNRTEGTSGRLNMNGVAPPSDAAFEALRRKLTAHAQRMLGSRAEAEDVVQDAWLKWRGASAADVRSPDAWLTTVTTRLAIDRLRRLRIERASHVWGVLPQPWLVDASAPAADEHALHASDLSYGVTLLLERLKPDERAAFVLHEALDCDYAEIAKILARTPAHCRQIVHRAKERLRRAGAPSKAADPAGHARLVERLRAAIEAQDRTGLVRLFSGTAQIDEDQGRLDRTDHADHAVRPDGPERPSATMASAASGTGHAATPQVFSLCAVRRLLQRIAAHPASWTRCGAVPVDIDA
jgi:RNA polymerase sigma factor (sigma-70 family)